MPPHVFGDVTVKMEISREEIFVPVVGIQKARDEAHALKLANGTEYGLGRFNGDWAIEEFTIDHWISVQHEPRGYPF